MTRDELVAKLRACKDESYGGDFEKAHAEADEALLAYINDPEVSLIPTADESIGHLCGRPVYVSDAVPSRPYSHNPADALKQAMARPIDIEALTGGAKALVLPEINGEDRPRYILALRAQALDQVQDLIRPDDGTPWPDEIPLPTPEVWQRIIEAAFPPPPMAGHPSRLGATDDTP